ncbi:unnamed protein product [Meloidogyne enterolobii]|uniref:Uncharacterized protein n=1 Tax=Meloidogyne enterolobii TaxID=390850 RepID=A0ACB0YF69_MELEN
MEMLNEDIQKLNISEDKVVSESSKSSSSANSVDEDFNGNNPKMKEVEEIRNMEM